MFAQTFAIFWRPTLPALGVLFRCLEWDIYVLKVYVQSLQGGGLLVLMCLHHVCIVLVVDNKKSTNTVFDADAGSGQHARRGQFELFFIRGEQRRLHLPRP